MPLQFQSNKPDWLIEEQKLTIGVLVTETEGEYRSFTTRETPEEQADAVRHCIVFFRGAGKRPSSADKENMFRALEGQPLDELRKLHDEEFSKYTRSYTDFDRVKNYLAFLKGATLHKTISEGGGREGRDPHLVKR